MDIETSNAISQGFIDTLNERGIKNFSVMVKKDDSGKERLYVDFEYKNPGAFPGSGFVLDVPKPGERWEAIKKEAS